MGVAELAQFVQNATLTFRKGAEVTTKRVGNVEVTEVYAMPESPVGQVKLIDVQFMMIGFTEYAADKDEFVRLLRESAGVGEFTALSLDDIAQGPSYITLGGWLGSQDIALRFIALGEHYGLWTVITPEVLGITDEEKANDLAGRGFVMFAPTEEGMALLTDEKVPEV